MNRLFLFLGLVVFPLLMQAQIQVSPKVGVNYLWVGERPQAIETLGAAKGWLAGVDVRLGKKIFLQPGIYYATTDAAIESFADIKDIRTGKASYMKLPLNVGVRLFKSSPINMRFHGGGVANKFLKVRNDNELKESDFNKWSYSANIGAGLDILLFSIDANYEIGLTDLYTISGSSKPSMFSITFGLKF